MRCFWVTKNFHRCKKNTRFLFCYQHKYAWIPVLLITIPSIFLTIIGLYKSFKSEPTQVQNDYNFQQYMTVKALYDYLSRHSFTFSNLFDSGFAQKNCKHSEFLLKENDFYFGLYTNASLFAYDYLSKIDSVPIQYFHVKGIAKNVDTIHDEHDSIKYFIGPEILDPLCDCITDSVYTYSMNNFTFDTLKNFQSNFYLPAEVSKELLYFSSNNFQNLLLKRSINNEHCIFIIKENDNKLSFRPADVIYKLLDENKPVPMYQFQQHISKLKTCTEKWLRTHLHDE